jgi:hypothetical protein
VDLSRFANGPTNWYEIAGENMENKHPAESQKYRRLRGSKEPLTIYLTPETMDRLRVLCALKRIKLSAAVQTALDEWLE